MQRDVDASHDAVNMTAVRIRPSSIALPQVELFNGCHLNLVVPSMTRGGAERCVRDVAVDLEGKIASGKLLVMGKVHSPYPLNEFRNFTVIEPTVRERGAQLRNLAAEILSSPNPVAVTHMIRAEDLRKLWDLGVKTIPVVHNSEAGWHDRPQAYHSENVPEVVAVCEDVAQQLRAAGLTKPITVLRHEVHARGIRYDGNARERIRARFDVSKDTTLIGMVGQFKAHKCYVRAVRVLAALRQLGDYRLVILGGWEHNYGAGRIAHAVTMQLAVDLGVDSLLICPGSVSNVEEFYSAFDVFLNTSTYEGMSIATLEAVQAGCPVVTADVGGQREAISSDDRLIADPSDIAEYALAIRELGKRSRRVPVAIRQPDLIPRLWAWKAEFGSMAPSPSNSSHCDVLFVTSNLNPGGAQRSLTNLLCAAGWKTRPWLCVLDRVLEDGFLSQLERSSKAPVVSLSQAGSLVERVGGLLGLARRVGTRTICFWNVDPVFKLLISKVLEHAAISLIDVSPGPMLFSELDETESLQRRIAFSVQDYLRRLDGFVSKYEVEIPKGVTPGNLWVVPNGVAPRASELPVDGSLIPKGADPEFALVTCCRLVPNKRLEWLVEFMTCMSVLCPEATLTIVGGVEQRHTAYFRSIQQLITDRNLTNMYFVGPRSDVYAFLPAFSQFIMVSRAQGCPNASLEAMACGLPVMANSDGGTDEQVIEGVTGYNVQDDDPRRLVGLTIRLFKNRSLRKTIGQNAKLHALTNFNIDRMMAGYLSVFDRGLLHER